MKHNIIYEHIIFRVNNYEIESSLL